MIGISSSFLLRPVVFFDLVVGDDFGFLFLRLTRGSWTRLFLVFYEFEVGSIFLIFFYISTLVFDGQLIILFAHAGNDWFPRPG